MTTHHRTLRASPMIRIGFLICFLAITIRASSSSSSSSSSSTSQMTTSAKEDFQFQNQKVYTPDTMRDFLMPLPSPFFFIGGEKDREGEDVASHFMQEPASSRSHVRNVQKIVRKLLDSSGENFQQTSVNILRDDEKANFFYGFAESDVWYKNEQIDKDEFGTGKIADTKHHVIKTKIISTQALGATVIEHPSAQEPEKSLNAKQEALKILEAQRKAKTESSKISATEKIAAREAKRKSDAEHTKQKRREKRRMKNSFEKMERYKRDGIVSGEQMGCELCESVAIQCFKELRWKDLMERNVLRNDEYMPAEKAVMSCLVNKCGGVTANPANAMKNRAAVPVPKPMNDRKERDEQVFGLASVELSTIRSPMPQFESYALTIACEEAFDVQTRNDVATKVANALKDLRDRDEVIRNERAKRGEITSKTTKKELLAEDTFGFNAAKFGCAFVCELNTKNMEDELKNLDNDQEEADEDKDDDYEEYINSRERHDEDANVHEVRPRFSRARHSKARLLARRALQKTGCHRSNQGWWTYEICFEKNITQYHSTFDNALKRVIIDESTQSSLGTFSASGTEERLNALYDDDATMTRSTDGHDQRGRELRIDGYVPQIAFLPGMTKTLPGYIVSHASGTYCDAIDGNRESVVLYACSNDLQTHVKVFEQTTCKYFVVVFVKELCLFKQFQREENVLIRTIR